MSDYETLLASSPDREGVTGELWYRGALVADVFAEAGQLRLQIHAPPTDPWWDLGFDDFQRAISSLRSRLVDEPGGPA